MPNQQHLSKFRRDNVLVDATLKCGRRGGFEPGSSDRGSRHLLKLRHQRPVGVGPVADSCDAGIRPVGLWRCAGEGDQGSAAAALP